MTYEGNTLPNRPGSSLLLARHLLLFHEAQDGCGHSAPDVPSGIEPDTEGPLGPIGRVWDRYIPQRRYRLARILRGVGLMIGSLAVRVFHH